MGNAVIARDFTPTGYQPTEADWQDYGRYLAQTDKPYTAEEMDDMYRDHLHWEINKAADNWKARQQAELSFETRHKELSDLIKKRCSALDYLHWRFEIVSDIEREKGRVV